MINMAIWEKPVRKKRRTGRKRTKRVKSPSLMIGWGKAPSQMKLRKVV